MPAMQAKLNLRLDDRTELELGALVEHFTGEDPLRRRITASDVARIAIHELHARTLGENRRAA